MHEHVCYYPPQICSLIETTGRDQKNVSEEILLESVALSYRMMKPFSSYLISSIKQIPVCRRNPGMICPSWGSALHVLIQHVVSISSRAFRSLEPRRGPLHRLKHHIRTITSESSHLITTSSNSLPISLVLRPHRSVHDRRNVLIPISLSPLTQRHGKFSPSSYISS